MIKKKPLKNKKSRKREKFLNSPFERYIFYLALVVAIVYLLFVSGIILNNLSNPLSNVLFAVINIFASIFIAYKTSYFLAESAERQTQKKLATSSIRHIRSYSTNLKNLKKIVDSRKDTTKQTITKQYFTEISNHIDHIMVDVLASEIDVKESVEGLIDEEYREEKQIELKLTHDLEKLRELLKEIDTAKGKKISELEGKIAELRSTIGEQVTSLPFAYPPNVGITDNRLRVAGESSGFDPWWNLLVPNIEDNALPAKSFKQDSEKKKK
jgi:hypothetical protein